MSIDSQSKPSTTQSLPHAQTRDSSPATVSSSRGIKHGRSASPETEFKEPESARPSKQLKCDTSTILSEENLRKFEAQNISTTYLLKKSSSHRSTTKSVTTTDITADSRGSGGSINLSIYRYQYLAAVQVRIHSIPPDHVKVAIDAILEQKPTQERHDQLKRISEDFHTRSIRLISASDSKEDSLHVLLQALQTIETLQPIETNALRYQEKADWREELKPLPRLPVFSADLLPTINGDSDEPRKRHQLSTDEPQPADTSQADPPYVSNTMPPSASPTKTTLPPAGSPAIEREGYYSPIKTPRPDVSIGVSMAEITSRLEKKIEPPLAGDLLPWLQNDANRFSKERGALLISRPALRASDLAFPIAVIEAKGYSTGNPIFEAQNQAAVAGACALKIQLDLENLARPIRRMSSDTSSSASRALPLMFFSVCTEGPSHELWAHYTIDKHGVLTFGSTLLKTCHASLLDTVEPFMIAFDNVCSWGTGEFLDIVVENLVAVANALIPK
ncbi:hypothetical protein F5Y14DRAFT_432330 [Nemania sp. NC0429]|nr:hypothetical protein F5Y14DRAFT_432330 [Nemania sp. NC0429]